jgi:phytoene dehydrogenase-like protein
MNKYSFIIFEDYCIRHENRKVNMQQDKYDAVVIGAGHNGLVTACYLQRAGLKVLVLERNSYIGGATTSISRYEDFTYSNCSYVYSLFRQEIARSLELYKYGLQVIPYEGGAQIIKNPDGTYDSMGTYWHEDAVRRDLERFSTRDANAFDRLSRDIYRQCDFIKPLLMRTPPDPTSFKPRDLMELLYLGKRFYGLGEERMLETIRFYTMSVGDYLNEYLENDALKSYMAGGATVGTALGVYSPGTAYILLHHAMGDIDGTVGAWGFARGGMGAVSKALNDSFLSSGGTVRVNAGVEKFIVERGKVKGMQLENGEIIDTKLVVSGMDLRRTFNAIDPNELPQWVVDRAKNFRFRGSSGKVNIALSGVPTFHGIPKNSPSMKGDLHISQNMDELELAYDDWKAGRWSKNPYLDILIPSLIDPTMTPEGKHWMSVFTQYCPYKLAEGEWNEQRKQAFGQHIVDCISAYSPDLKDKILHMEIRTPKDIEDETGLTEGNIFQGELTMDQLMFNRPIPGYAQYRSPISGLYMCGSSTHPGGGVMGAPGANAAREVMLDLGKRIKS